jgi:hypothetical protein
MKNDWKKINDTLRSRNIHHDQTKHIDCIRQHPTESDEHFKMKCKRARELFKEGKPFLTEVWTTDRRKRFDLLNLEDNVDEEFETGKSLFKVYKGDVVHGKSRRDSETNEENKAQNDGC